MPRPSEKQIVAILASLMADCSHFEEVWIDWDIQERSDFEESLSLAIESNINNYEDGQIH